jgi:hypothetical protein
MLVMPNEDHQGKQNHVRFCPLTGQWDFHVRTTCTYELQAASLSIPLLHLHEHINLERPSHKICSFKRNTKSKVWKNLISFANKGGISYIVLALSSKSNADFTDGISRRPAMLGMFLFMNIITITITILHQQYKSETSNTA